MSIKRIDIDIDIESSHSSSFSVSNYGRLNLTNDSSIEEEPKHFNRRKSNKSSPTSPPPTSLKSSSDFIYQSELLTVRRRLSSNRSFRSNSSTSDDIIFDPKNNSPNKANSAPPSPFKPRNSGNYTTTKMSFNDDTGNGRRVLEMTDVELMGINSISVESEDSVIVMTNNPSKPNQPIVINTEEDCALQTSNVERNEEITNNANLSSVEPKEKRTMYQYLKFKALEFYKTIKFPYYFLLFNIICMVQTVPALVYYISFSFKGFYLNHSSGMAPVWGTTIGAISSVIVTSALVPLPDGLLTYSFCVAIILWELEISIFTFIAGVCLAILKDYHGMVWSFVCCLSSASSFLFLRWFGLYNMQQRNQNKYTNTESDNPDQENRLKSSFASPPSPSPESLQSVEDVEMILVYPRAKKDGYITSSESENNGNKKEMTCVGKTVLFIVQSFLWIVLFVFYIIPAGFGVNQAMTAQEYFSYQPPGHIYSVPYSSNDSFSVGMHIYCTGRRNISRPTIIIEPDDAMSGFGFYALQNYISNYSIGNELRVCSYDRSGFGWSFMSPLGSNRPKNNAIRLNRLLEISGELLDNKISWILIGYGSGAVRMQIYANLFPQRLVGFVILDGYPNLSKLEGETTREIVIGTQKTCGNLNIARATETASFTRPVTDYYMNYARDHDTLFHPSSELGRYRSTMTNGRFWAAQFNDWCVNKGAKSEETDYLTKRATIAQASSNINNIVINGINADIKWFSLGSEIQVLILVTSDSLKNELFRQQAYAYNNTLSSSGKSSMIICEGCKHSFVFDSTENIEFVGNSILDFFQILF
eukprot:gene11495-15398_t